MGDKSEGRWVTIGASEVVVNGKTKKEGGTPVFITSDGKITKGPAGLKGKNVGELGKGRSGKGKPKGEEGAREKDKEVSRKGPGSRDFKEKDIREILNSKSSTLGVHRYFSDWGKASGRGKFGRARKGRLGGGMSTEIPESKWKESPFNDLPAKERSEINETLDRFEKVVYSKARVYGLNHDQSMSVAVNFQSPKDAADALNDPEVTKDTSPTSIDASKYKGKDEDETKSTANNARDQVLEKEEKPKKLTPEQVRAEPWKYHRGHFQAAIGVKRPWLAEISQTQRTRMGKRETKWYEEKRNKEWEASAAAYNEWRTGVEDAYLEGKFDLKDKSLTKEAKSVVLGLLVRQDKEREEREEKDRRSKNFIKEDEKVSKGQRVYHPLSGEGVVTKVNRKTIRLMTDMGNAMIVPRKMLQHKQHYTAAHTEEGRWVTIGAVEGKGGSPVFIKDGVIRKGAGSVTGKKIATIDKQKGTGSDRSKTASPSKIKPKGDRETVEASAKVAPEKEKGGSEKQSALEVARANGFEIESVKTETLNGKRVKTYSIGGETISVTTKDSKGREFNLGDVREVAIAEFNKRHAAGQTGEMVEEVEELPPQRKYKDRGDSPSGDAPEKKTKGQVAVEKIRKRKEAQRRVRNFFKAVGDNPSFWGRLGELVKREMEGSKEQLRGATMFDAGGGVDYAADNPKGRWVTIKGAKVFIENGQITKGPANLVGRGRRATSKKPDPDSSFKELLKRQFDTKGKAGKPAKKAAPATPPKHESFEEFNRKRIMAAARKAVGLSSASTPSKKRMPGGGQHRTPPGRETGASIPTPAKSRDWVKNSDGSYKMGEWSLNKGKGKDGWSISKSGVVVGSLGKRATFDHAEGFIKNASKASGGQHSSPRPVEKKVDTAHREKRIAELKNRIKEQLGKYNEAKAKTAATRASLSEKKGRLKKVEKALKNVRGEQSAMMKGTFKKTARALQARKAARQAAREDTAVSRSAPRPSGSTFKKTAAALKARRERRGNWGI